MHWDTGKDLLVKDITGVRKGLSTQVLLRTGKAKNQALYVSLVSPGRTLDMELASGAERDAAADAFKALMKFNSGTRQ